MLRSWQLREVALVVGLAAGGVLIVALVVIGPVVVANGSEFPQVTQVHTPEQPEP